MKLEERVCPLCGNNEGIVLYDDSMDSEKMLQHLRSKYINLPTMDGVYLAVRCDCGMMYQGSVPSDEDLTYFYTNCIPKESIDKRKLCEKEHYYGYAREMIALSRLLKKPNHSVRVLDFGMGWGYWCLMAKAFGFDVYGYDLSKERRSYARHELGINVLDKLDAPYDFINLDQVLEHVLKPKNLLDELYEHTDSGGYIHIHVPDASKLSKGFSNPNFRIAPWKALMPLEHLNGFTHKSLIAMAENVGYTYINQPTMRSIRIGMKSKMRGLLSTQYRQYRGTSLYFQK